MAAAASGGEGGGDGEEWRRAFMDVISGSFQCDLCEEDLGPNASLLLCGHSLCPECVDGILQAARHNDQPPSQDFYDDPIPAKCPVCRYQPEDRDRRLANAMPHWKTLYGLAETQTQQLITMKEDMDVLSSTVEDRESEILAARAELAAVRAELAATKAELEARANSSQAAASSSNNNSETDDIWAKARAWAAKREQEIWQEAKSWANRREQEIRGQQAALKVREKQSCHNCGSMDHWQRECPNLHRGKKCYRCYQYGHEQHRCTNPPKCINCWEDGHYANACPKRLG